MCCVSGKPALFYRSLKKDAKVSGKLFIIGTPIGNLSDISKRAISALSECSLLFVEDTRVSIKLLNHLGLNIKMLSCHKFNERERLDALEEVSRANLTCGLLSDAGMPLISDPGEPVMAKALELGMQVEPIAGPTAFVLALVGSGLPLNAFVYEGFLPDKPQEIKERLLEMKNESRTMVFYVSPHKLERTLELMLDIFGERDACLARELTKMYEQFVRLPLSQLSAKYKKEEVRGELVLVVAGARQEVLDYSDWLNDDKLKVEVLKHVSDSVAGGLKLSKAASLAAEYFAIPKSDIYREALKSSQTQD